VVALKAAWLAGADAGSETDAETARRRHQLMLARLIQFALTQRLLMLLLMLLLVGGGWQALKTDADRRLPGRLHHPGQDHRQGGPA
jgi:hypothetical protein